MTERLPRVLAVDDEPNILRALNRSLYGAVELVTAVGPEEGLRTLESDPAFDIVLSDMRMPGMDGVAFLQCVAQRWPGTVRILLTGMGDTGSSDAARASGAIHRVLAKPCPADELKLVITEAMRRAGA
ncbi:response regulator [Aquimonas voraii]|uniref:Response regulator receiver domain-containing protein n=1 Tax=Aquimonas voraii TaxID=265719 RepID=A0A1G6YCC4_9GAMM|nr:response regulator [Aquimonas voraii]SDD88124.1 Response regulator receiver domain-containing protein [Aquimonas voraii]